jgi:hypothetical protein
MPVRVFLEEPDQSYINHTYMEATLKVYIGRGYISRRDIVGMFTYRGVEEEDLLNVYQMERGDEWFVLFRSKEMAEDFAEMYPKIRYGENRYIMISMLDKQTIQIRVHWVPYNYYSRFVWDIVSKWGIVKDYSFSKGNYREQNIWTFEITVTQKQKEDLPYLAYLPSGKRFLITCPGRPPICSNCEELGHIKMACTNKSVNVLAVNANLRGYAAAAAHGVVTPPQQAPRQTSTPPNYTDIPGSRPAGDHYLEALQTHGAVGVETTGVPAHQPDQRQDSQSSAIQTTKQFFSSNPGASTSTPESQPEHSIDSSATVDNNIVLAPKKFPFHIHGLTHTYPGNVPGYPLLASSAASVSKDTPIPNPVPTFLMEGNSQESTPVTVTAVAQVHQQPPTVAPKPNAKIVKEVATGLTDDQVRKIAKRKRDREKEADKQREKEAKKDMKDGDYDRSHDRSRSGSRERVGDDDMSTDDELQ